jgi:hypothetical protein
VDHQHQLPKPIMLSWCLPVQKLQADGVDERPWKQLAFKIPKSQLFLCTFHRPASAYNRTLLFSTLFESRTLRNACGDVILPHFNLPYISLHSGPLHCRIFIVEFNSVSLLSLSLFLSPTHIRSLDFQKGDRSPYFGMFNSLPFLSLSLKGKRSTHLNQLGVIRKTESY